MDNDRTLLELAARAAGYKYELVLMGDGYSVFVNGKLWDPRRDDGDCARMEAVCALEIEWWSDGVAVRVPGDNERHVEDYADHGGDRQKARRYASTRAAAAIGKEMSK